MTLAAAAAAAGGSSTPAAGAAAPAGGAPAAAAAPAGGGAPAPAPGPSGAGGGQTPGAGAAPESSVAGAPYRPEGLPDHLLGASDKETVEKVFKAFDGYRRTEAERGTVPDKPEAYEFTPSETVKPFLGDLKTDGLFQKTQARAHAAGLTTPQFNKFLNGVFEDIAATGGIAPVDYNKELDALIPDSAKGLDEKGRKAAAGQRIGANLAWIEGAKQQMIASGMPKEAAEELSTTLITRLGDDAKGQRAIEWMRGQGKEVTPALNGGTPSTGITKAELDQRNEDPRNDHNSSKFDPAFAEETRRLFKQLYPG